jgi:tetratricopeptide (TPR) repeat protein
LGYSFSTAMNDWQDAERRFERALEFFQQRKWSQALEELRVATSINPFNGSWFFNLGLILDEMGRYDEALDAYRRSVRIEPENLPALGRLGADLYRTGRLRQALRTFQKMAEIDPGHEPSYCQRVLIYSDLGEHEKAEEMFYTARLYKEYCPRCFDHMGRSLAARRQFDRAIYCFQKCLDADGAWPDAQRRLGEVFRNKGDLEQARRHYLADLRGNPGRTQTLLDLGDLLVEMGRLNEAAEKYRHAIELAPGDPEGFGRYGRWLARCRRIGEAQAAFEQALRLDPNFRGANLELARLALRRHDVPAARRHLRAEHQRQPDDAEILLALANLWMDCGEDRTAAACLNRLLTLQPDNAGAWVNLAVVQFRRGMYQLGIRSCQQAIDRGRSGRQVKNKTTVLAMYNIALGYERLRQFDAALEWARHALNVDPRDTALLRLEFRLRALRRVWPILWALRRTFRVFV